MTLRIENLGDGIVLWTLDDPPTRNAVTAEPMISGIEDAVAAANADVSVRVVILTGAGGAFSSGGNVKDMRDRTGMFAGTPAELRRGYITGVQRIPRALRTCEVPVIAAVDGPAIGAGCDLATMCDLRIASNRAVFAESFVRLGIIPGDGGAWFLPRVVGAARAAEMAYTGEAVDAATALEWGLVSQIVEPESLVDAAVALARRIAVNPPGAVRMTKRLLRASERSSLDELLELSAGMQAIAHHTDDHLAAVAALPAPRTP